MDILDKRMMEYWLMPNKVKNFTDIYDFAIFYLPQMIN